MKFLIAAMLSAAPVSALANFSCKESSGQGYAAGFNATLTEATVLQVSGRQPKVLARLRCSRVRPLGLSSGQVVLSCYEPRIRDGGYSLRVQGQGQAATATLFAITIAGARKLAELGCR